MIRSHLRHLLPWALATIALTAIPAGEAGAGPPPASDDDDRSAGYRAFERDVLAWDVKGARRRLERMSPGLEHDVAAGIMAHLDADYAKAEVFFTQALAQPALEAELRADAESYLELSRGAQQALENAVTEVSAEGRIQGVFADSRDAIMAPYLFEVMGAAYERLGAALEVRPEPPVRFEFLSDPSELSLTTPLSLDAVYTTGTVGLCKYRRVMLVTPRSMLFGYGWADTVVHEYTHFLVSIRTRNRAPVWLQEGLAKLYETRWRRDAPPPLEAGRAELLYGAITKDELVTLEQMHPSIAMLPSQELAALAYVEVETMLTTLWEKGGDPAIGDLMDRVARGEKAKDAFSAAWATASGEPDDFDAFYETWKREWRSRTAGRNGELETRQFADGDADPDEDPSLMGDVFSHLGGGRARQFARLGVLLTLRDHRRAATIEYEKARAADPAARKDPQLSRRLGELYLELDDPTRALPLLRIAAEDDPDNPNVQAAYGRALLRNGRPEEARAALMEAVYVNPFIPSLHCDLAALARNEDERKREQAQCRE